MKTLPFLIAAALSSLLTAPAWAAPQMTCSTEVQYGVERREIVVYSRSSNQFQVSITPVPGSIPASLDRLGPSQVLEAQGSLDRLNGFNLVFEGQSGRLTGHPAGLNAQGASQYRGQLIENGLAPAPITCSLFN